MSEMQNNPETGSPDYVELTSDIVSAYVTHNRVQRGEIASLIDAVHSALVGAARPEPVKEQPVPPVPIKNTVRPDYIISLEDGRRYKSMKRHLAGRGLTPEQYREKWGLRPDYPMVAPNYSKARSELAKALGLGQVRKRRSGGKAGAKKRRAAAG
jgi:predicted transcriptional regulator